MWLSWLRRNCSRSPKLLNLIPAVCARWGNRRSQQSCHNVAWAKTFKRGSGSTHTISEPSMEGFSRRTEDGTPKSIHVRVAGKSLQPYNHLCFHVGLSELPSTPLVIRMSFEAHHLESLQSKVSLWTQSVLASSVSELIADGSHSAEALFGTLLWELRRFRERATFSSYGRLGMVHARNGWPPDFSQGIHFGNFRLGAVHCLVTRSKVWVHLQLRFNAGLETEAVNLWGQKEDDKHESSC